MTNKELLRQVKAERKRQDRQWGGSTHDDKHNPLDWIAYIKYQCDQAQHEQMHTSLLENTILDYRRRLVKIVALCFAANDSQNRIDKAYGISEKAKGGRR